MKIGMYRITIEASKPGYTDERFEQMEILVGANSIEGAIKKARKYREAGECKKVGEVVSAECIGEARL